MFEPMTTQMQTSEAENLSIYGCFRGLAGFYRVEFSNGL
jgi:hypothetical protein